MSLSITGTGRLVADLEIRFTQGGKAVGTARIASNERRRNPQTNEWEDGDSTFIDVTLFGAKAEAAADKLHKGTLVLVTGKLKSRQYENRDGVKVTAYEIVADEVAPAFTAASSGRQQQQPPRSQGDPWGGSQPANDPWAKQPANDEPPF